MISLFDTYNQASWDLQYSLVRSGYELTTIVVEDDGFLPEDVTSPYLYYTGFEGIKGRALYFNQLSVPDYWEIRGHSTHGEIFHLSQKRGQIHYAEPQHLRLVKAVDWFDEVGRRCVTDRYNRVGYRYAQTIYLLDGQLATTTYFDAVGREVIVEHHLTGDILLNQEGRVLHFNHRSEFVRHYLRQAGLDLRSILYNSLSIPFLTVFYMEEEGEDLLFWQEEIGDAIPGNMKLLLEKKGRSTKIVVQRRQVYERLLSLLSEEEKELVTYLGYLYPFKRQEKEMGQALILTNSDQIEEVEHFVKHHTDLTVHIGAVTEMSSRLMGLSRYSNVRLYPTISVEKARELFRLSSIYLDINHQGEILSAIRTAFEHQLVVLGFDSTIHQPRYMAKELVFSTAQLEAMDEQLRCLHRDKEALTYWLDIQQHAADTASVEDYQLLLEKRSYDGSKAID